MKYEKDGLVIENTNPVCDSLFIKQGWTPVKEEPVIEVIDESVSNEEIQQKDTKEEIIDSEEVKQDESVVETETKSVETEKKKSTRSSK